MADTRHGKPQGPGSGAALFGGGREKPQPAEAPVAVKASPFVYRDPRTIRRRAWLYGNLYIRSFVAVTVAPGGVGKSSLALVEVIAMATGRPLLGIKPVAKLVVWYVNLEDPLEEIERRVHAILLHYAIPPEEIAGRLFIDSGDECKIVVMQETDHGAAVAVPVVDAVKQEMRTNKIDVLVLDPFAATHGLNENDNNKINAVKNVFSDVARAMNASLMLVHHVRKGVSGQGDYTVDDGRGASALKDGARVARVLNGMTKKQGEVANVDNHRTFFNVTVGKANLAPMADKADWFRIVSVSLGNGGTEPNEPADQVGVVTTWVWSEASQDLTVTELQRIRTAVAAEDWRESAQSPKWVGHALAEAMAISIDASGQRDKVKIMLKQLIERRVLVHSIEPSDQRKPVKFIRVNPDVRCATGLLSPDV